MPALVRMADEKKVELPICKAVYEVLYNGTDARLALGKLSNARRKTNFNRQNDGLTDFLQGFLRKMPIFQKRP